MKSRISKMLKFRANIPVSSAANKGGNVVKLRSSCPLLQATIATAVNRNHGPSQRQLSPNAHHTKPHNISPRKNSVLKDKHILCRYCLNNHFKLHDERVAFFIR